LGLVTHVTETREEAIQKAEILASQIIEGSPDSVALAKRLYQETWVAQEEECLRVEEDFQRKILATWNQIADSARNLDGSFPISPQNMSRGRTHTSKKLISVPSNFQLSTLSSTNALSKLDSFALLIDDASCQVT
jgi:hypothetical protein